MHVGELGESLRQLVRLGLGEAVVGGVEVVVNIVGVGAVLNGNKVVVGSGEVCDACVVTALRVGPRRSLSSGTGSSRRARRTRAWGSISRRLVPVSSMPSSARE